MEKVIEDEKNGARDNNDSEQQLSQMGARWTERECTKFFDALKDEMKKKKQANFKDIARRTGRSTKECLNMYEKNQAFLSLPDGVASAKALHALSKDYFDNLEKRNKQAREWSTSRETSTGDLTKTNTSKQNKANALQFIANATSGNTTKPSPKVIKKGKRTQRSGLPPLYPQLNTNSNKNDDDEHKLTGKEKKDAQLAARNLVSLSPKPASKRASPSMSNGTNNNNNNFREMKPILFGDFKRKYDDGGFESEDEYQDTSPAVKQEDKSSQQQVDEYNYNNNKNNLGRGAGGVYYGLNNDNNHNNNTHDDDDDTFADVGGALDGLMTLADAATPLKKFNAKPKSTPKKQRSDSGGGGGGGGSKNVMASPAKKRAKVGGMHKIKSEEEIRMDQHKAMTMFGKSKIDAAIAVKYKTKRSRLLKGNMFLLDRRAKLAREGGYSSALVPPQPLPPPGIPPDHPLALMAKQCGNERKRKLAIAEWFMPAIDEDWFARNDFKRFVKHCQVDESTWAKQTRQKWREIRKALGPVRRLSLSFLRDERVRLEYHRQAARAKAEASLKGLKLDQETIDELTAPNDNAELVPIPDPCTVGQRVLAIHPIAKRAYVGSVLTVSMNNIRVQFDDASLGSEQCRDIDVMRLGVEYEVALSVQNTMAIIGEPAERDEDRKMGLIFSKATRRASGEETSELAFMGKQFSLEDGVLSHQNVPLLPAVKKEEPAATASSLQAKENKQHAGLRTPTKGSIRDQTQAAAVEAITTPKGTPTRSPGRRKTPLRGEHSLLPIGGISTATTTMAPGSQLKQGGGQYPLDDLRRQNEEKKFRDGVEKIRTSFKQNDQVALENALRNFRDEFGYERGVYEGDLISDAPVHLKTIEEKALVNNKKKSNDASSKNDHQTFLGDLVMDSFLVAKETARRSTNNAAKLREIFSETLKPRKKTITGFAKDLYSESTQHELENAKALTQNACECLRALRAFCDNGYERKILADAVTNRCLTIVKNESDENDELFRSLEVQLKRFASSAIVIKN